MALDTRPRSAPADPDRAPASVIQSQPVRGIRIGGTRPEHIDHVRAWRAGHEWTMAHRLAAALEPGMTVVDAGAYLGYFSLIAARAVGRRGHVLALEPHPESYAALVENIRENGFEDRVTPVQLAVADRCGTRVLKLGENPAQSTLEPRAEANSVAVECVSLDELLPAARAPDLVKVDVEGCEVRALRGMERTLLRAENGFVLIVELNPEMLRGAGSEPGELLGRLRETGLRMRVINERTGLLEDPDYDNLTQRHWVNLWLDDPPAGQGRGNDERKKRTIGGMR